ncbi:FadR family transcriptional regulator [Limibaculum sp. M0105]|uniref:FadR family transcriptional regulator n=1 Tax=Thermohalobaculum xanthum TaxID=2753746 RepID=A0A8J7SAC0_9RHOB|nr:FCD domain-containing protein [Thermohalobaculum xanthum]MBK0398237.1 FadR family transcriptional regulator [Thermohalobaculum xanthum]
MLTRPDRSEREEATARLRALIEAGGYRTGDRLPPERELISTLGMSRTTLRKGLEELERQGAIWRHVGKGTFVAGGGGIAEVPSGSLAALGQQLTPMRMMRARLCIEPAIAREAAINASREAVIRINLLKDRAAQASSWSEYERYDDLFHRAVAEASDNLLLVTLFDQLNEVRRAVAGASVVRDSIRPPEGHSSFSEHEQISAAIEQRDPLAAQDAMRRHIGSVSARLFGEA